MVCGRGTSASLGEDWVVTSRMEGDDEAMAVPIFT